MHISTYVVVGVFLFLTHCGGVFAAEIRLYVVPEDIATRPEVVLTQADKTVPISPAQGKLVADMEFATHELRKPILIKFTSSLPPDYQFQDMSLDIPFTEKNIILEIPLAPTKLKGSAKDVRALYGTDVKTDVSNEKLPQFYQEVRAVALARIQRLNKNWNKLSIKDIQAVFIYLATVRELNERMFIVPPEDIADALQWMMLAKRHNKKIVKRHGLGKVEQLIRQVEATEGHRFRILWDALRNMGQDCETKYPLLLEFKEALFALPNHRAQIVYRSSGAYKGSVLAGIAECLSINIRCGSRLEESATARIDDLIRELKHELVTTKNRELSRVVRSAARSLAKLKTGIVNRQPLICTENGS